MQATVQTPMQPASHRPMMRHPVTVAQALMFLERHSHTPRITPEGILVHTWCKDLNAVTKPAFDDHDEYFEEAAVFPVVGNVVDLAPIREWQGY